MDVDTGWWLPSGNLQIHPNSKIKRGLAGWILPPRALLGRWEPLHSPFIPQALPHQALLPTPRPSCSSLLSRGATILSTAVQN